MNELLVNHIEQELLSADHAVIFPAVRDISKVEYLRAVGSVIGTRHIHSVYQNDDYVKIYLKSKNFVSIVIDADINVKGFRPLVNHKQTLSTIILSNVDPTIPDCYIEKLLQSYGIIRSSITRKKLSDHNDFSHIISGERQVILEILPGFSIPNCLKFTYESVNHEVFANIESHITVNSAPGEQSSSMERILCFDSLEDNTNRLSENSSLQHSDYSSQSYSNGHKRERRKNTLNIKAGDSTMIPFPWENAANKSFKHITELKNLDERKTSKTAHNNEKAYISHRSNKNPIQISGCDAQVCFNADVISDNAPIEILSASSVLEGNSFSNNSDIHFNNISNAIEEVNHSSSISIKNTRCNSRKNAKELVDEISIIPADTINSGLTIQSNIEEIFVVTDENDVPDPVVRSTDNKRRRKSATSKKTNKTPSKSFTNKLFKMKCVNEKNNQLSTRTNQSMSSSNKNIESESLVYNQCFKEHPILQESIKMLSIDNSTSITAPVVAFNDCSVNKGKHSKRNSKYPSCSQTNPESVGNIISVNKTGVTVSFENESSYHTNIKNRGKHSNFSDKTTPVKLKHKHNISLIKSSDIAHKRSSLRSSGIEKIKQSNNKVIKSKIANIANATKTQTLLEYQSTSNVSNTDQNVEKLSVTKEVACEELNCNFIFSSNCTDEIEVSVINLKKDETVTNTIIEQAAVNKTAENELGKTSLSMLDNSVPNVHINDQSMSSISFVDNNKDTDDYVHVDTENIAVRSQCISNCEKKDACCSPIKLDEAESVEKSETLLVSTRGRKKRKQMCKPLEGRKKQKLIEKANFANDLDQCKASNLSFSGQFGNMNTENHNLELNNQVPITFKSNLTDKVHIDIDSDSDTLIIGSYMDDPKENNEQLSGESTSKDALYTVETTIIKSSSNQSLKEVNETDVISQPEVCCKSSSDVLNTLNKDDTSSNIEILANKNKNTIAEDKSKHGESSECGSVSTTQKNVCLLQSNEESKMSQKSEKKLNSEQLSKQLLSPNKILRSPSKSPKAKKTKDMGITGISLDDSIEEFDFSLPPSTINEIESYLLVDLPNSNLQDDSRNNENPNACQKLDEDSSSDSLKVENSVNERELDQEKNYGNTGCNLSTDNLSSNLDIFNASSPNLHERCNSDNEKRETVAIPNSINDMTESSVSICKIDHSLNSESLPTIKISNEINVDLDAMPMSDFPESQDTPDNLENKEELIPNNCENKKDSIFDNLENKEDSIPNIELVNVTTISNEIINVNLEDVSVSNLYGCQDIPSHLRNNELANNIVSGCSEIANCEENTSHTSLLNVTEICNNTLNDSDKLTCTETNILEKDMPEDMDNSDLQIKISNYTSLSYQGSLNGTEILTSSDHDKSDISSVCLENKQYSEAFPFEMPTQFSNCLTPTVEDNVLSNKMLPTKQRNFRLSQILPPKKTSTVSSRAKRLKLKQKVQKKVSASLECLKMANITKNSTSCVGSPYDFDESQEEVLSLNSLRINRFRKLNKSYKFLKQPNKKPLIPCVVLIKEKNNMRDKWRVKMKMRDQDNFPESQNLERNETIVNFTNSESDCDLSQMYKESSKNIASSDLNTDQICSKASHPLKVLNKCPETSIPLQFCSNSSQTPLQNGHDELEESETSTGTSKIDSNSNFSSLPSPTSLSGHTLDSNTFSKDSNKETVDSNHFENEINSSPILPSNTDSEITVPCENLPNDNNPVASENNTNSVSDELSEEEAPSRFFQTFVAQSIEVQPVYEDIYSNYQDTSNMRNSDRGRSFMNFPLSKRGLIQFITEVKHHRNPRTYALKVLSKNKTPGSLRALILQLYAYFRICKKRENKLRISKLIKSLDERYARC